MASNTSAPQPPSAMAGLDSRFDQMFPVLSPDEIDRTRRFGETRGFKARDLLVRTGEPSPGMFVILSGRVSVYQRDGLGHVVPIVEETTGQFLGEVAQLAGRPALVDVSALTDVETLLLTPENLRRLLVAEADLGEKVMRALILRRVGLIQSQAGGIVLVGPEGDPGVMRLQNFLTRNGQPHHLLDPESEEGGEVLARYLPAPEDLPLVIAPDGRVLRNPSEAHLGGAIGMVTAGDGSKLYDLTVVGAGPAGLATAVYAASEGLEVAVLETRAFGGQAGASARIENYLGFPTGISGQALAGRAFVQAQKFGAEIMLPLQAMSLDCSRPDGAFEVRTSCGGKVRSRAVVIASGARYRRLEVDKLEAFEGRGVWYWASPIEARLCAGEEVVLVGGGNSAGQAAVFLSGHASKVRMMVRRDLSHTMSRYLIDRIAAAPNIELMTRTEVVALDGDEHGLRRVRWLDRGSGAKGEGEIRNLFLFVGADPATEWLADCGVEVDKAGFVKTGEDRAAGIVGQGEALQTSVEGVFAVGDVRSGSVKRVGGAIGEGAQVVAALHRYLARERV